MPMQGLYCYSRHTARTTVLPSLTCRWKQEQVCDIAPVQSGKSLLRGQESTACLGPAGVPAQNGHLQEDLSLPELLYRASISAKQAEIADGGEGAVQDVLGLIDEGSHVCRRAEAGANCQRLLSTWRANTACTCTDQFIAHGSIERPRRSD